MELYNGLYECDDLFEVKPKPWLVSIDTGFLLLGNCFL